MESKALQLPSLGLPLISSPFWVYSFKICWLDGSSEAGDKLDFFKECLPPHSEQALEALMIGRQVFTDNNPCSFRGTASQNSGLAAASRSTKQTFGNHRALEHLQGW